MTSYAADIDSIHCAAELIEGVAHRTPVATCATLDRLAGRRLFFKCEHLQKAGSFKFRGAYNAVMRLSEAEAAQGVVTHSSGNHGQSLTLAAKMRDIKSTVIMPENSSPIKRRSVESYNGTVILCGPTFESRVEKAAVFIAEKGGTLIPSFNHPDIISGQGTVALELLEQAPGLDAIVVPCGGGGLIAGIAVASQALSPSTRIFAVEPVASDGTARSKKAGKMVSVSQPQTIADGLKTSPGDLTWPIIRDLVEHVFTVGEEQIAQAMRLTWERAKLLIEPSSAVAVAGVLSDEFKALEGLERVAVVLSGGNVNIDGLPW